MNKTIKKNVVVSAILAIMLCVSLIAGATFALFTSESSVNIAVSSGKVNVKASVENLRLYSAETVSKTQATNYREVTQFANGGTATLDEEGNLTLDKMTPGDRATFTINVANNSNVAAVYRTSVSVSNDTGLYEALDITVDGTAMATKKTAWKNIDFDNEAYDVIIDFPAAATEQDVKCTLTFTVEAMQGNAVINDITAAELAKVLTTPNEKGVVELDKDYDVVDDWTSLKLSDNLHEQYTLNGNGHTITGLTMPLLGTDAAKGISISNLTISASDIGSGDINATNSGAFVAYMDDFCCNGLSLNNCHTKNVNVKAKNDANGKEAFGAGSLVGYLGITGASVSVTNCTVTGGSVINKNGNDAGIVGHIMATDGHDYKIENCKVSGCKIEGEKTAKTGQLVGTINNNGTLYINDCTYTGNAFGRVVANAQAIIDGVPYVTTLAQFTAAVNGSYEKVVLAADITNDKQVLQTEYCNTLSQNRELTIDLGGKTLNTTVKLFKVEKGATLTLKSSVTGGKIYCNSNSGGNRFIVLVDDGGTLNIEENVTIEAKKFGKYGETAPIAGVIYSEGIVNMNGSEIIVHDTVAVNLWASAGGAKFNMNGGKITIAADAEDFASLGIGVTEFGNNISYSINLTAGEINGKGWALMDAFDITATVNYTKGNSFIINVADVDISSMY